MATRQGMSERTEASIRAALAGRGGSVRAALSMAGPAVIASVAYMDPGNFATNIQAGARYGYTLLWVVVAANLVAMLFQCLSARLGIVTGRNLAELSRDQFPTPLVWVMWVLSEVAAMATDLAEFIGGAIGLSLLFGIPLLWGMVITAIATYGILLLQRRGFRPLELAIAAMVGVVGLSYVVQLILAPPDWAAVAYHAVVPQVPDAGALTLAVGIVGATVMPHAIFLHSGLTQSRFTAQNDQERRQLIRWSDREVIVALGVAGLINLAMVAAAARVFHPGHTEVAEIEQAYQTLIPLLGTGAAYVFLVALIASGLSSSAVGTVAGQIIMQGFVRFHIPLWLRRGVTMLPAFAVVLAGYNATQALVASQVVLSLALPVPMLALLALTRRPDLMGQHLPARWLRGAAVVGTVLVLVGNLLLIAQAVDIPIPFVAA